ncbi:MAG: DUF975 family protein [Anaerovorax sp.]|nr:DUF975 family protein [Anaerovorax sp.]
MEQNVIVSESSSDLRTLGRQALTGNWTVAVLGTLIQLVIVVLPVIVVTIFFESHFTENIVNLYSFLISGPVTLGYAIFTIHIFRRIQTTPSEIFSGFEYFGKSLGLYFMTTLFTFLWALLFIIPGIIAAYRYSMVYYILADNPEKGIMQCIRESKQMMVGNKWKLFCLEISFIGWAILCIFTLGIGTLWLTPYMSVSTVAFYEIAKGNLKIRRIPTDDSFVNNNSNYDSSPFEPVVVDDEENKEPSQEDIQRQPKKEEHKIENPFEIK